MENQTAEVEVNNDQLRQEILTETKGVKSEGKKPWELRLEADHPEMIVPPAKKEKIPPRQEEEDKEDVQDVPDDKPEAEEQPAKTESAPAKEQPEEEAQPVEAKKDTVEQEDAYITEYAKKSGLSKEEAKAEVESLRAISKKYGDDPVKIAKAYREVQSAYDKQKVQASSNVNPAVAAIAANPRSYVTGEVKKNSEKLIKEFRSQNPARSRDMDDEQVEEEIIERGTMAIKDQIRGYEIQLKKDATNKREEFIKSIPEADRRYTSEIKSILEQLPDYQVVGPTFRFNDLLTYARGKDVDRLIKEAEERIHKQYAVKDNKIVGNIARTPQTTKVKQTPEQSKSSGMSKWDKDQALQMFASAPMSDEEKFEAYLELNQSKSKKNKK